VYLEEVGVRGLVVLLLSVQRTGLQVDLALQLRTHIYRVRGRATSREGCLRDGTRGWQQHISQDEKPPPGTQTTRERKKEKREREREKGYVCVCDEVYVGRCERVSAREVLALDLVLQQQHGHGRGALTLALGTFISSL
jgi:hypothetical protein